ncbi:MAG: hypothetical protein ACYCQJ_05245 [Nitrososphaerales archaeon]
MALAEVCGLSGGVDFNASNASYASFPVATPKAKAFLSICGALPSALNRVFGIRGQNSRVMYFPIGSI